MDYAHQPDAGVRLRDMRGNGHAVIVDVFTHLESCQDVYDANEDCCLGDVETWADSARA